MKNDNTADFNGNRRQKILILQLIQGFNEHNHIIKKLLGFIDLGTRESKNGG